MRKSMTKIVKASVAMAMAIGAGTMAALSGPESSPVFATGTAAASFSRSGTTNSTSGGTFSTAAEGKSGYYQDGSTSGLRYLQILNNAAYWTSTPDIVTFNATIGGGSGNTDLTNPVQVVLLCSGGSVISTTTVTSHITTSTGDDYSISITPENNVYGVKLQHQKQEGYNVRYYSFSLSYEFIGAPTTYTVTYEANGGNGTMTDGSSPYTEGSPVTVLANSFNRFGYTFTGFNTAPDGSGTPYSAGGSFNIGANTTLYAQWAELSSNGLIPIYRSSITDDSSMNYETWSPWTSSGISGYAMAYDNDDALQFKNTAIFNTTPINGRITSISMSKASGTNRSWVIYGSDTATTTENFSVEGYTQVGEIKTVNENGVTWDFPENANYPSFICKCNVNNASYIDSILVNFEALVEASVNGDSSVDSGSQWASSGITENVSGDAVTGATYSFVAGQGVVISSSDTENGTFTATGSGVVTVKANKGGYNIASLDVTVVASAPYIEPVKTQTSGFTGQIEVLAFASGNLASALSVVSSNDSVIEVVSFDEGAGTANIKFVGAGNANVLFKDGGTQLAQVSVEVTQTTLSIESTAEIERGEYKILTATHNADAVGGVNWASNNAKVTVNANGKVSVAEDAAIGLNATITATSSVDDSVSATCVVTVIHPFNHLAIASSIKVGDVVFLACSESSMQFDDISDTATKFGTGVDYSGKLDKFGVSFEVLDGNAEDSFAFKLTSGDYAGEYLAWASGNSLATSDTLDDNSSWVVEFDGDNNATIKNAATPTRIIWWNNTSPRFACYENKENTSGYLKVQLWKSISPDTYLSSSIAVANLDGDILRLGSSISVEDWAAINSSWEITDYGVMIYKTSSAGNIHSDTPVEDAYRAGVVQPAIARKGNGTAPTATDGKYVFTARMKVSNPDTVFCAASFIVAGGRYYFFNEQHVTAGELA